MIAILVFINYQAFANFFTIEQLKKNNECLAYYVKDHYLFSVLLYIAAFSIIVACGLPLIFPLALIGGFLYGLIPGLIYATISCLIGSLFCFMVLRYVVSDWVRNWHNERIDRFNQQINKYGYSYLLMLHFLSVIPIFVINLLAAVAKVPLSTVAWVTVLGTLPLNLLCVMAGKELSSINSFKEIFSPTILTLLGLLVVIAIAPMVIRKIKGSLHV
ncbi:hypothetical protein BH09DEP1_BH09DEP1_0160 [soil metagenome]